MRAVAHAMDPAVEAGVAAVDVGEHVRMEQRVVERGVEGRAIRFSQDGAVALRVAASGRLVRVVGACASVVGCRGGPGRATCGGRRPWSSL